MGGIQSKENTKAKDGEGVIEQIGKLILRQDKCKRESIILKSHFMGI